MKLLEIQSSVRQERSASRTCVSRFIDQWQSFHSDAQYQLRDIGSPPPALITANWGAACLTVAPDQMEEAKALLVESDALITELVESDRIVLGVPMCNFGIPAHLNTYFDMRSPN